MIVLLSGGTGGAKLARGLFEAGEPLAVVANTADDVEVYGVHVSPDPDLVTYWLADAIDERGWGLRGDTSAVMDALRGAGVDTWFQLGDRDLAMCLLRTARLRAGEPLTEAHAAVVDGDGRGHARASDERRAGDHVDHARGTRAAVPGVHDRGAGRARRWRASSCAGSRRRRPSPAVLAALASAELVLIGPSNPVISIGPILGLPGMREALAAAAAPVVAVSPFVDGRPVKGPTEAFCAWAGIETSAAGVARAYGGVLDGIVADEPVEGLPCLVTDTLMDDPDAGAPWHRRSWSLGRTSPAERAARAAPALLSAQVRYRPR